MSIKLATIDTPSLQSVKKLKMVEGDMYMTRSRITRVDALQEVTGRLDISGSSALKSCKRLVSIGGFLNIRKVHMQNFREAFPILKTIGEHNGVSVMLSK